MTTTFASAVCSLPVTRSKYCTPFARPFSSTRMRPTTAFDRISSLPVFIAAGSRWSAEQKNDPVSQPAPQLPQ